MKANKPLKLHGSKHYISEWIISNFPQSFIHYVEPYFGSGTILFAKPMGGSEVVNDIDKNLINFWNILADEKQFKEFHRIINSTPFSSFHWCQSKRYIEDNFPFSTEAAAAAAFFILNRQSRQGLNKDFATLSKNRTRQGVNEQTAAYWSAVDDLPEFHQRLRHVVILCNNALDVIEQQDGPNTFFYLDPPYLPCTRITNDIYEYEMQEGDHEDLLKKLSTIKGKFLLSGYFSKLYNGYAQQFGWNRVDKEVVCHASSQKIKPVRIESLWKNY